MKTEMKCISCDTKFIWNNSEGIFPTKCICIGCNGVSTNFFYPFGQSDDPSIKLPDKTIMAPGYTLEDILKK